MADQHAEYEKTSGDAFTGEAAQRLRDAEKQAAELPEQPEEEDEER